MQLLFACFLLLLSSFAFSQKKVIDVDKAEGIPMNSFYTVNGEPFVNTRFVRLVEGTPYFRDAWMKGIAVTDKNMPYQNNRVKLDLFSNELHFQNDQGQEMICTMPLKEVVLTDTVTGASYAFVLSSAVPALASAKPGWYLQLASGEASLFVGFTKTGRGFKPYNSSVEEQRIYTTENFLLVHKGAPIPVKKPKELPGILADKKESLEEALKSSELKNASNTDQMAALVIYYNSLQ